MNIYIYIYINRIYIYIYIYIYISTILYYFYHHQIQILCFLPCALNTNRGWHGKNIQSRYPLTWNHGRCIVARGGHFSRGRSIAFKSLTGAGKWAWFGVVSLAGWRGWILVVFWSQRDGLVRVPETQWQGEALSSNAFAKGRQQLSLPLGIQNWNTSGQTHW